MNNFISLTKVFFLSGFNVNRRKHNQKSSKGLFIGTLALFFILSFALSASMIAKFKEEGAPLEGIFSIFLAIAFAINLIMSITQLQSIIFNAKDYEFLESLPVSKTCIVSAKLVSTYLINLAEDIALIIPAAIMYVAFEGEIVNGMVAIFSQLFIAVAPILISAIFGSISALLSAKSKRANLVNIVVSLVLFLVFFTLYIFTLYGGASQVTSLVDKVFFLNWANRGICGELIYTLYYVLFNLGLAVIVTLMIVLLYQPVNAWLQSGGVHEKYDMENDKKLHDNTSIKKVLFQKEWSMVYRRPQYFINSILGCFFFLITSVIFIFAPKLFVQGEEIPESLPYVFLIMIPMMGVLMNSITSSTAASISFEGRTGYEKLRSYPIDPMNIIWAKVKVGILLEAVSNIIVSLILVVLFIIRGVYYPYLYIEVILFPQLAGMFTAILGMVTGLKWPKLDYENEAQVLKSSAAANLLILFVMLPSFFLFGIHVFLTVFAMNPEFDFLNYVDLGIISFIFILVILIFRSILKKKGKKMFNNIIYK